MRTLRFGRGGDGGEVQADEDELVRVAHERLEAEVGDVAGPLPARGARARASDDFCEALLGMQARYGYSIGAGGAGGDGAGAFKKGKAGGAVNSHEEAA